MTRAEEMRKIKEQVEQRRTEARKVRHNKYVQKLIDGKVRRRALVGCSNCAIKVSGWYSPTLTAETFTKLGFTVVKSSKNGKTILTVKW